MSCIRFSTPAQLAQLTALAPSMLTREEALSRHPSPVMTESKIRRLRLLALSPNPQIRESVASNPSAPADLLAALSRDADEGVRGCIARNTAVPAAILRILVQDDSPTVRGWIAVSATAPEDVIDSLAGDDSKIVRGLIEWRQGLATA